MLFNFQDGNVIVINFIRVYIFYVYSRIDLEVEMLLKLDISRLYQKAHQPSCI